MADNPPGLDLEVLLPWFREHVAEVDSITARVIGHGRSNITYAISESPESGSAGSAGRPARTWVLRRPPLSHVLPTAHDMAREFRVMSALHPTGYPVPEPLAYCEDPNILDRPFYVMSFIDGFVASDLAEFERRYSEKVCERVSRDLIETLVKLHLTEATSVGLADFGKPKGFAERQVSRWVKQLEKSKTRDLPELDELAARLARSVPPVTPEGIVHGDYRLDNTVLDNAGKIIGVLDWEMATLGDPLADLGMLIMYWSDGSPASKVSAPGISSIAITALPGFLSREQAIAEYAKLSGFDLTYLDFYVVLAYFKLAIIIEGIQARFLGGGTVGEGFDQIGALVGVLANMGIHIADESGIKSLHGT
ncbi:MAG: acyl-CoA dehydrogenase [Acidobacteria bacterium]|nr:MAG: acyl-CoA dehydrogenase [Acidobacteriota bacterium]